MVLTGPVVKAGRVGRLKVERWTLSVDLCRFAKVGETPEPQTTVCPAWRSQELIQIRSSFVAAAKLIRRELHDKKSSGSDALHSL
jgi:hypothetical protein